MKDFKKDLAGVADAAAKIMGEALKGQQHKIDKNKNNKIDAHDFAILRGEKKAPMKKEEVEQVDEASYSAKAARAGKDIGKPGKAFAMIAKKAGEKYGSEEKGKAVAGAVLKKLRMKEDMEITDELADIILEYESKNGVYKHEGKYAKGAEYGSTEWDKENSPQRKKENLGPKKYGARQNFVRSTRVNEKPGMKKESFTGILGQYQEGGLKHLFESFKKEEQEVLSEEVKEETIEVPVMDANEVNGVKVETIEERTLTEPESAKKEEIVKSMKKKMSGFKERYGDKAKSVMYATATKMAKKGA